VVKDDIFSDPLNANAPAGKKNCSHSALPKVAVSFARESHDWIELFQIFAKKASFCGHHSTQRTPFITLKNPSKGLQTRQYCVLCTAVWQRNRCQA
jgi:hypothetical protein